MKRATGGEEARAARVAAAIGEPARAQILFTLMSNRAHTSTELALVAGVSPSTASTHLQRLRDEGLVTVVPQGKHRYYSLASADVATLLEGLAVFAGARPTIAPTTPVPLRAARTCYDHLAGALGVAVFDRLTASGWLVVESPADGARAGEALIVSPAGETALSSLGVDVPRCRRQRRRFAFACLDWSERRPHLGGALGAALLALAVERRWVAASRDHRALRVTAVGRRALGTHLGLHDVEAAAPAHR